MSVVLRCPICGTAQEQGGECEACSEAEVQYFCTNHEEGIWLNSAVCSVCGATYGDAPRKRPAPGEPGSPPARGVDYGAPMRPARSSEPEVGRHPPRRPAPEGVEPEVVTPSLGEFLEAIAARARARRDYDVDEGTWTARPVGRGGFPILGCLGRIVGLVVLFIMIAIVFLFLLFGGFIVN